MINQVRMKIIPVDPEFSDFHPTPIPLWHPATDPILLSLIVQPGFKIFSAVFGTPAAESDRI